MKSENIIFIILLLNILVLPKNAQGTEKRMSFIQKIKENGVFIGSLEGFWLEKSSFFGGRSRKQELLVGKDKENRVCRLEIIKMIMPDAAEKYIRDRRYVLESLFKSIPSPYPGEITNAIEVPQLLKPEIIYLDINNSDRPVYILYSTERLTYGAGSSDLISYRGALTFIYDDKKNTLFILEFFVPKDGFVKEEVADILKSFRFNNPDIQ